MNASEDLLTRLAADRERAHARIAALTRDVEEIVERSSDAARDDEHDPEGATIAFERAQAIALLSAAREHLMAIDAADERVRRGEHGRCVRCGGTIPAERLRARPTATSCIGCARQRPRRADGSH